MIEQSQRPLVHPSPGDLDTLQQRANQVRARHRQSQRSLDSNWRQVRTKLHSPFTAARRLPTRFLLHTVVALVLPLAVALSQIQPGTLVPETRQPVGMSDDFVVPVAPLSLDMPHEAGDAPLTDSDQIPVPLSLVSRSQALAPVVVPASIAAERIYLRNGPGTHYDAVGRMSNGSKVQVIGRYGDWYQVRESVDKPVYWVSGELLDIPPAAIYTLFEVAENAIPAPPPPKIGFVREGGLQLRDGPGTNYVSLASLIPGQIDLLERYQDWLHVSVAGNEGWVKAEFIDAEKSVLDRLLAAETIPDPNPTLVGATIENRINLRKGPDSRYERVGMINAGVQLDLIGQYKDWFRIQTPDGNKAWIFSDFINVTAHVERRVPTSKDFPALPVTTRRVGTSGRPGSAANLAGIAASGDVAGYAVQFVGSAYRWGGAGPGGFDCSGLTSYVYRQAAGVRLPHSAAGQFSTAHGASVGDMGNLAPGDLVFFVNTGGRRGISHVAIYVGGGRIVHAMTPRYGVQVSNIWESYWQSHYYGGIRVRR